MYLDFPKTKFARKDKLLIVFPTLFHPDMTSIGRPVMEILYRKCSAVVNSPRLFLFVMSCHILYFFNSKHCKFIFNCFL
jgi:hypothetical protein